MGLSLPNTYSDTLPMREARDQFLAANGFRVEDYTAPTFTIRIWGVPFKYPNTKAHRWATPLHDMHHLLTEYGTDWIGEAEMAAWELRAGCKTLIVYWLNLWGVAIGLFISPQRVWRAWQAGRGKLSLYRDPRLCDSIMELTVGEVRLRLGLR